MLKADSLSEVSIITVRSLQRPTDIVACREDRQLYVIDQQNSIWRVSAIDPRDRELWQMTLEAFHSLSLTSRRLLVTLRLSGSLRQYSTTDGKPLHVIKLPECMKSPRHAVETTHGTFVVSHDEPSSAVCQPFSFIIIMIVFISFIKYTKKTYQFAVQCKGD